MSEAISIISITPPSRSSEAADEYEAGLARWRASASRLAESVTALDQLVDAMSTAFAHGNTFLVGYREGIAAGDVAELRTRLLDLTDHLMPDLEFPSEAATLLAYRNAKRRTELLREFGALTGEQIAEERSRAANRHALAARWRKEGRLFGVPYRGQMLYPGFQFDDDGVLRPVISEVLAALPRDEMSEWEIALWWTAGNGVLGGRRPVDLLDEQPQALVPAARRLSEPLPV